jgi:hypothetical protein
LFFIVRPSSCDLKDVVKRSRSDVKVNSYSEAVVTKPVVDLHAITNARSERVTQVILGNPLVVGKDRKNWLWVTTPDAYKGWIEASATRRLRLHEPQYAARGQIALVTSNVGVVYLERLGEPRESLTVALGTRLELVAEESHRFRVRLPDRRLGWVTKDCVMACDGDFQYPLTSRRRVVETAKRFLGVPYLWGGTTPLGFDCSGMVQQTFKLNGVNLPRDADQQFQVGMPIEVDHLEPADLLFFSNRSSGITHVGIFIGSGQFLHSSGKAKGVTVTPFRDRFFQSVFVGARRVWRVHSD